VRNALADEELTPRWRRGGSMVQGPSVRR
jgi:hypothetical protein